MSNGSVYDKQRRSLDERRRAPILAVDVLGVPFEVFPGVYDTGTDTTLMAESVRIGPEETFLEIGCGPGAVALLLAARSRGGLAVDVNERAVQNARRNAERLKSTNVTFAKSDVFDHVTGKYDVIICNPPYHDRPANDAVEVMFWDPNDDMKRRFFLGVRAHLHPGGRVYFGWANFPDLDPQLPLRLAKDARFLLTQTYSRTSRSGEHAFLVFAFSPQDKESSA